MILSSNGQPGLGKPSGQVALGRLKSPPKMIFGVTPSPAIADFTPFSGVMKSLDVDGFPLLLSSGWR